MKSTGAAITNNYENSIQKREIKNNTQQRKETSSSDIATSTPITSVSRLESMGMANLEKSKYYQTQVSLMQKSEKAVDNLFDKLYELEDTNNNTVVNEMQKNMEIQEIIKGVEAIVDGEDFQKNEILSNINIQSLGLDGYISSAEKEKALNDALLQVRVKKNELSIIKEKNENELTKLRLANENLKAANTTSVDKSNLSTSLNNIKSGIETNPMDIRNLSQARVMNILNN